MLISKFGASGWKIEAPQTTSLAPGASIGENMVLVLARTLSLVLPENEYKYIDMQLGNVIGENIVEILQSNLLGCLLGPKNCQKFSWPAIYKLFSKTDAPSFVIFDMNSIRPRTLN